MLPYGSDVQWSIQSEDMQALKYHKVPSRDVSEPSADSMSSERRRLNRIDEIIDYLALTKQMSPTRKSWNTTIH